jgi:hypothetical protein
MQHMTLPEHKLLHFARCIANDWAGWPNEVWTACVWSSVPWSDPLGVSASLLMSAYCRAVVPSLFIFMYPLAENKFLSTPKW